MFGSVFRFSHLKTAVSRFWGLQRFAGSRFRFSSTMMANFRVFCLVHFIRSPIMAPDFIGFSGVAKEVTSRRRAKTGVIPRAIFYSVPLFLVEKWMTSLVCLAAGKAQDCIIAKNFFSNIARLG